ncbi:MAG TPA: hypothetical protein VGQ59_00365 [Cyclobacteriaceae bacterium]|jgi:hypothetical protein|nr:hypothetical protein [Cyclobacteriaceae bacterium]
MKKELPLLFTSNLIFVLISNIASAQTDYAVRLTGDTIKGNLQILDYEQIERVQIKTDNKKISLTALQTRSIRKNNEQYRPVKYENTARFMKVLKDGYLSLYAFHLTKQSSSWDGRYLTKLDGTGMEVPNLSFKKSMGNYLSDCGDIKDKFEKGELGKGDVEKIVDLYNACMQNKTAAAIPKSAPTTTPPAIVENEKVLALKNLVTKVEAENFNAKKDALDILKDIQSKVVKNESVPNYLLEGLKSSLADVTSLTKDVDSVIVLLKK